MATFVRNHIFGTKVGFGGLGQGYQEDKLYAGRRAQYRQRSVLEQLGTTEMQKIRVLVAIGCNLARDV